MTTVTFFRRPDGFLTGFKATGHADYAEYGSDIVCAAISALTQGITQGILKVAKANAQVKTDEESGLFDLKLESGQDEETLRSAQLLLKTLELSLTALSQDANYSRNIRIITRERR